MSAGSKLARSTPLLGLAFLSLAVLLSVLTHERTRASGLAIATWFFFVLVFDLLLLGALVATGGSHGGAAMAYLLLLNPADVFRILNVFSLEDVRTRGNVNIREATAEERQKLRDATYEPTVKAYLEMSGEEGQALIDIYEAEIAK